MLPSGRVEFWSLEFLQPGPLGIPGDVEEADRTDQRMADVDDAGVECDRPDVAVVVPGGRADGHAQLQMGAQAELVDGVFEVRLQFGLAGVGAGPVVGLERVAVEIGVHVDFGPGIRIVPPRPLRPRSRTRRS